MMQHDLRAGPTTSASATRTSSRPSPNHRNTKRQRDRGRKRNARLAHGRRLRWLARCSAVVGRVTDAERNGTLFTWGSAPLMREVATTRARGWIGGGMRVILEVTVSTARARRVGDRAASGSRVTGDRAVHNARIGPFKQFFCC